MDFLQINFFFTLNEFQCLLQTIMSSETLIKRSPILLTKEIVSFPTISLNLKDKYASIMWKITKIDNKIRKQVSDSVAKKGIEYTCLGYKKITDHELLWNKIKKDIIKTIKSVNVTDEDLLNED